jgi:Bacterial regulatory proteins, tetR family
MANGPQAAADTGPRLLWFNPPDTGDSPRRALTRERVVAEALTVISADGAGALSMRALAARLGVVPAALYRHVRAVLEDHPASPDCGYRSVRTIWSPSRPQ